MQVPLYPGLPTLSDSILSVSAFSMRVSTAPAPTAPVPTLPEPLPESPEIDPDESVPLPTFTPDVNPDSTPLPNLPLLDPDEDPKRFGTCRGVSYSTPSAA